jgi:hypothetical protein
LNADHPKRGSFLHADSQLEAENLVLHQQIIVLRRTAHGLNSLRVKTPDGSEIEAKRGKA